jgi:hypothetical protein
VWTTVGRFRSTALGSDGDIHVECLAVASASKSRKIPTDHCHDK